MVKIVKKWENNNRIRMLVHDGIFHADDVLCVALAGMFLRINVEVIRTRDESIISDCDICCDIKSPLGNLYIPNRDLILYAYVDFDDCFVFDHHTEEKDVKGNDTRKRYPSTSEGKPGILYSSASHFFEWITSLGGSSLIQGPPMSEERKEYIIEHLLKPVACQENGQELADYGLKGNPLSFVSYMNILYNDEDGSYMDALYDDEIDANFMECVFMTMKIIRCMMEKPAEYLISGKSKNRISNDE